MNGETLSVAEAGDAFLASMDDSGFFPGDEGYVEPEQEQVDELETEQDEVAEGEESEEQTPEEDEADEGEAEGDEEEEPEGEPEEQLFELQIGDDTYEVNAEELKAGYLRNEAYVARATALEHEYESKAQQLEQREAQVAEELNTLQMMQAVDLQKYQNVNWNQLKAEDPEQYTALRLEALEAQERFQATTNRRQQLQALHAQAQRIKQEAYERSQAELVLKLLPDFANREFQQKLLSYGKEVGLSEDEILGITDARHLVLLNQARLYSESQIRRKEAMEKKVVKELPKVVKPGAKKPTQGQVSAKALQAQRAQLKKSGSVSDAANVMLNFI